MSGDPEFVEQPAQRGIGPVVVDQEGRVDTDDVSVATVEKVGVCVTADAGVGLEHRHPVLRRQHVGGRQACDSTADDSN